MRLIVERALGLRDGELYQRYLIAGTSRRPGTPEQRLAAARKDVWASDMEASAKLGGWGVPFADRRPGDLLFNYRAAEPQGHVAILIDRNTVIENAPQGNRPISIHLPNSMCITPVEALSWTLAARVPDLTGGWEPLRLTGRGSS